MIPVHILLSASLDQTGKVTFTAKSPLLNGKKEEFIFNKINQGMAEKDYHQILFKLIRDDTGLSLKLPTDLANAFWVIDCTHGQRRCPDHNDTSDYSEFKPTKRADDTTLVVENYNEFVRDWMFSVNFLKQLPDGSYNEDDQANYVRYDPGGVNQDYSVKTSSELLLFSAGSIGLVAGCLLTLGVQAFT
jgi:hypothetical protein